MWMQHAAARICGSQWMSGCTKDARPGGELSISDIRLTPAARARRLSNNANPGMPLTFIRLLGCLALCLAVALFGAYVTAPQVPGWYAGLAKPAGTPPNWIFPVVWNALYALMGVSLWLLWDRSPESNDRRNALAFFWIQLLLNAAWSPMFFGAHQLLLALIIILLMIVAVGATIAASWQVNRVAALLLVPYLACSATRLGSMPEFGISIDRATSPSD
jgi:translocator protein